MYSHWSKTITRYLYKMTRGRKWTSSWIEMASRIASHGKHSEVWLTFFWWIRIRSWNFAILYPRNSRIEPLENIILVNYIMDGWLHAAKRQTVQHLVHGCLKRSSELWKHISNEISRIERCVRGKHFWWIMYTFDFRVSIISLKHKYSSVH